MRAQAEAVGSGRRKRSSSTSHGSNAHSDPLRSPVVYFSFTFSATGGLDIYKVAQRLFKADVAEAVVVAGQAVELSPRYRSLEKTRHEAQRIADFLRDVDSPSISLSTLFRHHIWMTIRLLPAICRAWWWSRRHSSSSEQADSAWANDLATEMEQVVESVDHAMQNAQIFGGLRSAVDRNLYAAPYMASEPFLRLELRSPDLTLGSSTAALTDTAPVWLTVHRSGTLVLTLAVSMPAMATRDVVELAKSTTPAVRWSSLPEPLLVAALAGDRRTLANGVGQRSDEVSAGTNWWAFDSEEDPTTIEAVFDVYRQAILHVLKLSPDDCADWFCFSSLIANRPRCCSSKANWLKHHPLDAEAIVARSWDFAERVDPSRRRAVDRSDLVDTSVFLEGGIAAQINWDFEDEHEGYHVTEDLMFLGPIEHVVLQYGQLLSLDRRTMTSSAAEAPASLQLALSIGLEEYERPLLTYGTTREIADLVDHQLRMTPLLQQLRERVAMLAQLTSAKADRAGERRAARLALLALVATAIFSPSAIRDSLEILFERSATDAVAPTRAIYAFLLLLIAAAMAAPVRRRLRFSSRRRRPPRLGHLWVGQGMHVSLAQPEFGTADAAEDPPTSTVHPS